MGRKTLAMILCIVICLNLVPVTAFAVSPRDTSFEETLAGDLKALGLFKGVSDTDFDLNRAPSRLEAIIMLIRVLGMEQEALNGSWWHPFTDVAPWADSYVGYAYQNGLTKGISDTLFGAGTADACTYLTFVLRALGYSDTNGADFTWNNPYDLARYIGALPDCVDLTEFMRADVAIVSYAALEVPIKASTRTLAQKLISAKVFALGDYETYYDTDAIAEHESAQVELTAEEIYAKCSPAVFYVEVYNSKGIATASGSGFFIDSLGNAVTNFHVIEDAYSIKIILPVTGETYDVIGVCDYDEDEDWAVLKINGSGFPYLKLSKESSVAGGATVYAIGSPLGLQNTISQGLISNPKREFSDGMTYIQTSAAISHGSSGGALINKYGEVVGITTLLSEIGQNLNMAIPVSYIADCKKSDPVSLTTLFSLTDAERQVLAFSALRDWLIENANKTVDGKPVYVDSDDTADYALVYESDYGAITSEVFYFNSDTDYLQMAYVTLVPSVQNYIVSFSVYYISEDGYEGVFSGEGDINGSTFTEDTAIKFTSYTGDSEDLAQGQKIAQQMILGALDFIGYIYSEYLPKYGLSDFGFIGFDLG